MTDLTITPQVTVIELAITQNGIEVVSQPIYEVIIDPVSNYEIQIANTPYEITIEETATRILEVIKEGPRGPQGDAGTVIEAIAGENISALRIVRAINSTDVIKSDSFSTFADAKCLGIALNGANIGDPIRVQFFGAVGDPFFNFPVNAPLFLTSDGQISDDPNSVGNYNTTIGYSLGAGAIFIDLQEPIEL